MIAQKYWQKNFVVFACITLTFALVNGGGVFAHNIRIERPYEAAHGFFSMFFQFPRATLHQFQSNGVTPIPEGGTIAASAVMLGASLSSATFAPLRLQVEVRSLASPFAGVPTAASGILFFTKTGMVTVSGLTDGSYHWRARLENAFTGATSAWQAGGDFTVVLREPIVLVPGIAGTI